GAVVRDALGAADGALEGAGTADGAAEGRMSEPKTRDEAVVKIACVQMEPVVGEKERNVRRTLERVEQAAARGWSSCLSSATRVTSSSRVTKPLLSRKRSRTDRPVRRGKTSRASTASIWWPALASATGRRSTTPRSSSAPPGTSG